MGGSLAVKVGLEVDVEVRARELGLRVERVVESRWPEQVWVTQLDGEQEQLRRFSAWLHREYLPFLSLSLSLYIYIYKHVYQLFIFMYICLYIYIYIYRWKFYFVALMHFQRGYICDFVNTEFYET